MTPCGAIGGLNFHVGHSPLRPIKFFYAQTKLVVLSHLMVLGTFNWLENMVSASTQAVP